MLSLPGNIYSSPHVIQGFYAGNCVVLFKVRGDNFMRNAKAGWFGFQTKMLLTYIFVISVPFTIAFVIFTTSAARETRLNHTDYMVQLNRQINYNIDTFLTDVDRISFLHIIDSELQNILSKEHKQDPREFVEDLRKVKNSIALSAKLNPLILAVTFVGRNGNVYSNVGTDEKYLKQLQKFMSAARESEEKKYISPVYDGLISFNRMTLLSLTRVLYDSRDMKEIGFVSIDIDFKRIRSIFEQELHKTQANNLLIIQEDRIIYNSLSGGFRMGVEEENALIRDINQKWGEEENGIFDLEVGGTEYLFVASKNETTGWNIIQFVSLETINKSARNSIRFYSTTMFLLTLFAVFVGYILSWRMAQPINKLHAAMKQVEKGNLAVIRGKNNRKDEIGMLINSFNHMIERLKESINKEYIAKMNQKRIELKMLQAQINPHFLYNTLSLISSISEIKGVPEISRISNNLSEMFRYNIKQKDIVTIKEELEQINNYISIQQMRFPNKIFAEIEVDESFYGYSILKFLLQPLVENAIYHGLEKKDGQGIVRISAERQGNNLLISVIDNGKGIPEEQVVQLSKELEDQNEQFVIGDGHANLGIKNVHYRIRAYYGEQYGLKIYSNVDKGTCIQITIPQIINESYREGENI